VEQIFTIQTDKIISQRTYNLSDGHLSTFGTS
jgi:hypothetical protein